MRKWCLQLRELLILCLQSLKSWDYNENPKGCELMNCLGTGPHKYNAYFCVLLWWKLTSGKDLPPPLIPQVTYPSVLTWEPPKLKTSLLVQWPAAPFRTPRLSFIPTAAITVIHDTEARNTLKCYQPTKLAAVAKLIWRKYRRPCLVFK